MISEAIINLGVVVITCLLLTIYLIKFVFRYKHEYESNPLCTSAVVFCLLIVLLTTFVLPVDIFLVSFVKESDGTFKQWATNETLANIDKAMFYTYYSLYGVTIFLLFSVIPFLHFLNADSESSSRGNAFKYTLLFVLMAALLLGAGVMLQNHNPEPNTIFDKILPMKNASKVENALVMILSIITMAGFINVSFYTASGIFSWPIGFVLGTASVSKRVEDNQERSEFLRVRINNLHEKARVSRLTGREQAQLVKDEDELRQLDREQGELTRYSSSWTHKLRLAIRPIQTIHGICFGALSVLLLVTLVLVNVDRILHGAGVKQGYILLKPQIFNPLEFVFTKLQDLIFIGPLPLLVVMCFLVVATISGIRNLGLWFMLARVYRVKQKRTPPQALLFFCITMMLAALAFNMIIYSMASQYTTFGNQKFQASGPNGTHIVTPCTLADYHSECILTRTSILLMQMMSYVWIFGAIFYWWSWTFVAVASVSFIAYLMRGKRQAAHDILPDQEDFEE